MKRGIILVWALVMMAVTTTILGSLGYYYASVGRIANFYMKETESRFAGQRAVDEATKDVREVLEEVTQEAEGFAGMSQQADIDKIVEAIKKLDGKTLTVDGYGVTLATAGQDELKAGLQSKGVAEVQITATVTRSIGGVAVTKTLEQTLTFTTEAESALTTLPIFDFVYFANNYGRLNSAAIVANGEVGANADFEIEKATINGFVKCAGEVTLATTEGKKPKIWPRSSYMAKVAAEYDAAFTQVRPTDPITGHTNGVAYTTKWVGGYDPASSANPYSADFEDAPSPVANPGNAPDPVPEPTLKIAEFVTPDYEEEPSKDYPTEPKKGVGDYAYPTAPYSAQEGGGGKGKGNKTTYWYYKNNKYSSKNYYWYGYYRVSAQQYVQYLYADDKAELDAACEVAHDEWKVQCAEIDATYNSTIEGVKQRNEALKQQALQDQADLQAQYDAQYAEDLATYNTYLAQKADWDKKYADYQQYLKDLEDYEADLAAYLQKRADWASEDSSGTLMLELTKETYAESSMTNLIVKENLPQVEWPAELASWEDCRTYCMNYESDATNKYSKKKGYLLCENQTKGGEQISFTLVETNVSQYISSRDQSKRFLITLASYKEGEALADPEYGDVVTLTRTVNRVESGEGFVSTSFAPLSTVATNINESVLAAQQTREAGSVILIGTAEKPIEIFGPVFVDGDVVIQGFVRGQGTIYARRNIHIIGELAYESPPNWPHEKSDLDLDKYSPGRVKTMNANKDLLNLVALGNIIVGDYTAGIWTNATQMAYLKPTGTLLAVSSSDGVGSKNHDYTAEDGAEIAEFGVTRTVGSEKYGIVPESQWHLLSWYYRLYEWEYGLTTHNRRYYESKFGSEVIGNLKQTSAEKARGSWQSSVTPAKKVLYSLFGIGEGSNTSTAVDPSTIVNEDAGDITGIDAILFANHGIFGVVGGTSTKSFTLNGALICRDEGLLTSFDDRFGSSSNAKIWLNWDMRIKSNSAEGIRSGLIEQKSNASGEIKMYISDWRQVASP